MSAVSLQSTAPTSESQSATPLEPNAPAPVAEAHPVPAPAEETPVEKALRERAFNAERSLSVAKAIHAVNWLKFDEAEFDLEARAVQNSSGAFKIKSIRDESKLLAAAEAVQELATLKPEWVRAVVKPGTGAQGSVTLVGTSSAGSSTGLPRAASAFTDAPGAPVPGPVSYKDLLRPENKHVLQEFIHHKKVELERMRTAHFGL